MIVEQGLKKMYQTSEGACCLASRNAEMLERAGKLKIELSVLSLRVGKFRSVYL